jgi:hypothetical protein
LIACHDVAEATAGVRGTAANHEFQPLRLFCRMTQECSLNCLERPLDYMRLLLSFLYPNADTKSFNKATIEKALQSAEDEFHEKATKKLQALQQAQQINNAPIDEEFAQQYQTKRRKAGEQSSA